MSELDINNLSGSEEENEEAVAFVPPSVSPIAGLQGEFGAGDVRYPYFSIIQGVGPASALFPRDHGNFIYGGNLLVPKPVLMSFYGVTKRYRQNLRYDPTGPRPKTWESAA